jgi:hypothetical protein
MPEHYHSDEPPEHEPVDGGLTGYAIAKYGFILIITIVVLYFIAAYILPLI